MEDDYLDKLPSRLELQRLRRIGTNRIKQRPKQDKAWPTTDVQCIRCGSMRHVIMVGGTSEKKAYQEFTSIVNSSVCSECEQIEDGWTSQDRIASILRQRYNMMQEHLASINPASKRCNFCSSRKMHTNVYHDSRYTYILGWRLKYLFKPLLEDGKLWEWIAPDTKPSQLWKILENKEKQLMSES